MSAFYCICVPLCLKLCQCVSILLHLCSTLSKIVSVCQYSTVSIFHRVLILLSYLHVFCSFVFAPVQRNWACFTWKGALEIRSLLLSLFLVLFSTVYGTVSILCVILHLCYIVSMHYCLKNCVCALLCLRHLRTYSCLRSAVSVFHEPPRWPSGKAFASRAEGPGFESRLRRDFFGVESYLWLKHLHSSGYPARRLAL